MKNIENSSITFVCCIEYGVLENQTLLMLKTFRANAGRLKNSRILAIQPRMGVKLNANTISELKRLSTELIIDHKHNPYTWFNYANKIAAVKIAQSISTTDLVAWLDSDILISDEPLELILEGETDFAARCEYLPPAVHSNQNEHVPYWIALNKLFDIDYHTTPILDCDHQGKSIKMYFNSGVFVWRKKSVFIDQYYNAFKSLIESRISQHTGEFFTADQVIIGPVLIKAKLKWHHLAYTTHHMTFQSQIEGPIASPSMKNSAIIHYSKSLFGSNKPKMMARIKCELPHIYESFVDDLNQMEHVPFTIKSIIAKILRNYRGLHWKVYQLSVKKVSKG